MNNRTERPRPSGVSRRTVVKGAAWAVPAITVASAVPAMAASQGPIYFTGNACKLPGASIGDGVNYKQGYVFELIATNVVGPNPLDVITVISAVTVNGVAANQFEAVVTTGVMDCGFGPCGSDVRHEFCTPDDTPYQRILIYADMDDSAQAEMCITYTRYEEGAGDTCVEFDNDVICSGEVGTPSGNNQNVCKIPDIATWIPTQDL